MGLDPKLFLGNRPRQRRELSPRLSVDNGGANDLGVGEGLEGWYDPRNSKTLAIRSI